MPTACHHDRIAMNQRERDVLKVMQPVLRGERSQVEAAGLLGLGVRQARRIQRKLQAGGDAAVVHGLRGKPSNHQPDGELRRRALEAYRQRYSDFGPTFACEKMAEEGLRVCPQTLRRWLLAEGLWQRRRRRDAHRSRRPRRACFGELVQMDASIHDWLEGRGGPVVLISMIDDATSRVMARFYPEATVLTHMDLLSRWLRKYGRPVALYTDRHSIFEPQDKGQALPGACTQFGRALKELGIELIRAHSPQAKGRVERSFGTAQDRWVKEMRLRGVTTAGQANEVLARLLPGHNRRFAKQARDSTDAHRPLGPGHDLEAILSVQTQRVVSNDYVVRLDNRFYQLLPPPQPGLRGGRVVIEERLDGTKRVRFRAAYVKHKEIAGRAGPGGPSPSPAGSSASAADAGAGEEGPASEEGACPPAGKTTASAKKRNRPAPDHPYRRGLKPSK